MEIRCSGRRRSNRRARPELKTDYRFFFIALQPVPYFRTRTSFRDRESDMVVGTNKLYTYRTIIFVVKILRALGPVTMMIPTSRYIRFVDVSYVFWNLKIDNLYRELVYVCYIQSGRIISGWNCCYHTVKIIVITS